MNANQSAGTRPVNNVVCVICGKTFHDRLVLSVHQKDKHNVTPRRSNPGKRKSRNADAHSVTRHSHGSKTFIYKCSLCDKLFSSSHYLKKHIVVHATIDVLTKRVFACGLCRAKFYHKSFLVKHVKLHL
ncbi:Uncharacterised protein r2_g177 [Pycnogonum litorale]